MVRKRTSCGNKSALAPQPTRNEGECETECDDGEDQAVEAYEPDLIDVSKDPGSEPGSEDHRQTEDDEESGPFAIREARDSENDDLGDMAAYLASGFRSNQLKTRQSQIQEEGGNEGPSGSECDIQETHDDAEPEEV